MPARIIRSFGLLATIFRISSLIRQPCVVHCLKGATIHRFATKRSRSSSLSFLTSRHEDCCCSFHFGSLLQQVDRLGRSHTTLWKLRLQPFNSGCGLESVRSFHRNALVMSRTNNNNDDDFGDDSFLADFDVDQAIRVLAQKQSREAATPPQAPTPAPKRVKKEHQPSATLDSPYPTTPTATFTGSSKPEVADSLTKTLQSYFGYSQFRPGQLCVLEAVVDRRDDTAIFWATGSGKSLCYQIPALHTGHVAVVISPLISLMQDQVHKLNYGLASTSLATFLGSGQSDPQQEDAALRGEFSLIYVTPEKLLSNNFLDKLAHLHTSRRPITLLAVDESHCVSEWGHDFRPEFRQIGNALRNHPILSAIPIMALTATASPRVQADIIESLHLRSPFVERQSLDRTNLEIVVRKKDRSGSSAVQAAFEPLVAELIGSAKPQSTIIYAPTRDQVESICSFLQQRVASSTPSSVSHVEAYHAGLSSDVRASVHTNFLTGKTLTIVATVAFGMGIDKPDTRRVIHFGPPKTMEEYYQQIGRAGRDGLKAECIMWVSDSDFDRYHSDFYLGKLTGQAKQATLQSMGALRQYALEQEACRRKTLLSYFEEVPSFGERCGTCDTCRNVAKYGPDTERDFGPLGARIVLQAVASLDEQGLSVIEKVVGGNAVEPYRYRRGHQAEAVQKLVEEAKQSMKQKRSLAYYRELVAPLVTRGYLCQGTKQTLVGKFARSWTTYDVTIKGLEVIRNKAKPILLPVPDSVRRIELQEVEQRQRMLEQLAEKGVDLSKIPEQEIAAGDGEALRAYGKWSSHIAVVKRGNRHERVKQLEQLIATLESWRLEVASKYKIAPGTVLPEHLLASIAYTVATMAPGMKVDGPALIAAGVRTRELDSLVSALGAWVDEVQPAGQGLTNLENEINVPMLMPIGSVTPPKKWEFAVYKPVKKTGLASWESSYLRFSKGEPIQAIAMSPASGRPIQVNTVAHHVLEALQQGRPVNLKKLSEVLPAPTKEEWRQLMEAEDTTCMNVCGNPHSSGPGGANFTKTEFLKPIIGSEILEKPFAERSEEERHTFGRWCNLLEWYMALRRSGYDPEYPL